MHTIHSLNKFHNFSLNISILRLLVLYNHEVRTCSLNQHSCFRLQVSLLQVLPISLIGYVCTLVCMCMSAYSAISFMSTCILFVSQQTAPVQQHLGQCPPWSSAFAALLPIQAAAAPHLSSLTASHPYHPGYTWVVCIAVTSLLCSIVAASASFSAQLCTFWQLCFTLHCLKHPYLFRLTEHPTGCLYNLVFMWYHVQVLICHLVMLFYQLAIWQLHVEQCEQC